MTREERNKAINFLKVYRNEELYTEECRNAHEMAIEALEQEPCADMISRDAMWEVLQRLYGTEGELVEELMSLPPVLPIPKIGRWNFEGNNCFSCTSCGTVYTLEQFTYMVNHRYDTFPKFCPQCGSYNEGKELRMQGVEE